MLTFRSDVLVTGVTGRQITDFLLTPTDGDYRRWWPGTHLRFHVVRAGRPDHRGDVVRMDEFVGSHHLRMSAVVMSPVPGRRIVWRMGRLIPLPIRLTLDLSERPDGVAIRHTITAGFTGLGRVVDPLLRLYFTDRFATAMDEHAQQEFRRLPELLTGPCHAAKETIPVEVEGPDEWPGAGRPSTLPARAAPSHRGVQVQQGGGRARRSSRDGAPQR